MGQQIDIVANLLLKVDNAEAGVNKLKSNLSKLKLPDNLDKNLTKSFANLDGIFERYRAQLNKGFKTKGDITNFSKVGKELDSEMNRVAKYITELTGKSIDFKINSEPIKQAEQNLEKLLQKQKELINTALTFKIEGKEKISEVQKILTEIQDIAGNTKAGKAAGSAIANLQMGDVKAAKADIDTIINSYNKLGQAKRDALVGSMGMNISDSAQQLKANIDAATQGLEQTKTAATDASNVLQQMRGEQIGRAANEVNKMAKEMERNAAATNQANKAAQEYAQSSFNMAQQLEQLKSSTQYFFGIRNMLNLLKRGFHEAIETVKELDAAMTETAVVTKFDVGDMWEKLPEYTANANALGATVQDMYESTTLYYQQGLNAQQAMSIATETMKMARIGGLEAAEATDMMTAALRGFNMELNETSAQRINDVYSNLAAKTASNTEELGTAMQRTASIAASAGMSFEGTAAFLAQAIETTREPAENLGTAMKTIVARFQELKKNPLEISDVEGEEVNFNKVDAALKTIGVSLMDTNGQFRDLDQVFLDISQKWDSLTQTQQRYIATTAAGSRQQSRFIAMMSNYERTLELMSYANDSEGASAEQFGKTMESLEAKLNKLKNAWDLFTMGLASNSMIKGTVDGLTTFINGVTTLIDKLSVGSDKLKSILTIFTAFTGLRAAGKIINGVIGGIGGALDPNSSIVKGAFGGGFLGNRQAANVTQAKLINQPIVNVLNQILGTIRSGKIGNNVSGTASFQEYKKALSNFKETTNKPNTSISDVFGELKGLDAKQVSLLTKSNVGTTKQLQRSIANSLVDSNNGNIVAAQLTTAMKRGNISGKQLTNLNKGNIGTILGTQEAEAYSNSFIQELQGNWENKLQSSLTEAIAGPDVSKEQAEAIQKQMENNVKAGVSATKGIFNKYSVDQEGNKTENPLYNEAVVQRVRELTKGEQEANREAAKFGNNLMKQKTPLESIQQGLSQIGGKAITAGQGLMSLGTTLNSMGFEAAGAAVSSFGSALSNVGMIANGIPSLLSIIPKLMNPLGIMAAGLAVGFGIAQHKINEIKEAGEKVVKDFTEQSKVTEDNISKIKAYKNEFAALSQGVDSYGNNINLDDSQYQRYLEIVDDIASINPDIVDGYNAQGHAIISNNAALDTTLKKLQDINKQTYETYTSEESLQALINARNVNSDFKRIRIDGGTPGTYDGSGHGNEGRQYTVGIGKDVSDLAKKMKSAGFDEALLKKYNIESFNDLKNGEEQAVRNFIKHRQEIENELRNSGIELSDALIEGFSTLGEDATAFEEAIKPVYDNLLTSVSKSNLFTSLAPEIQSVFKEGLKDIASQDLSAKEMRGKATLLGLELQTAFDKAKVYLDKADEALNTYANDLNKAKYDDAAGDIADNLRILRDEAEAAGQVEIAEWYENQAARIENAITDSVESIADSMDTLADNIAAAKSNFEALGEGIDDYYTLADQGYKLTETALEQKNIEGEGSKTFWRTYKGLASEEAFNEHDIDKAVANMKQFQKYFTEGAEGSRAFAQKMIDWQEKTIEGEGDLAGKKLKDFFELAEDGTMHVTDAFTELSDEQYAQLASVFDLSADGFTAILNKLRQFGDLDFTNILGVRKAIALDDRSIKTNKEIKVNGEEGTVNRLYYGQSMLEAEMVDKSPEEKEKIINDLEVRGSIQLPSGAENLIKAGTGETKDGSLLKQLVDDTKGNGNQVENVMTELVKSGEYSQEDLKLIHSELVNNKDLLSEAADANVDFDTLFGRIENKLDDTGVGETNNLLSGIDTTVNTIAGIVAAGKVKEGVLPELARQSENLYNDIVGTKGELDTWVQKFSKGQDEEGNAITDQDTYDAYEKRLSEWQTANDNYIADLETGLQAAIDNGASPETIQGFKDEIEQAKLNAKLMATYAEDAANSFKGVEKGFSEASQSVFTGLAEARGEVTDGGRKAELIKTLQTFASDLQNLNFSPEKIQSVFDENFGIKLELENGEFATDIGEQISNQINSQDVDINAILNISSIQMNASAKGKNNTPSAIRRVGTMARGSKRGYTIDGEPTLTGELGPELVWEPKQNSAYMVGEHGPQFANISKNAVVWNAKQTKRIKKNSKGINPLGTGARGIHSFGTMSLGAGAGGGLGGRMNIPGTFEINATANILDVIPPTPEPEIPVKAKLEVEGETTGGILGKLFGGKQGPSINVAANITSINTGEQLQTISVIGNVTKLNTESTVNDIQASAVVTQVTKGAQVAGEPISVKAVATTTTVKNETPAPKPQVSTSKQTMNVTANTAAAQAKINQLIQLFNKTYTLKYKASGPSSISVPIKANFTGSWEKTVKITKSGAKGINNRIHSRLMPAFGSAAAGRYGTIGPKGKGGLTLTGEKGFEIAWLPSENRSMVLGTDGPQMLKLPSDVVIYNHEQSKKILKQKGIYAGSAAENTGTTSASGSNIFEHVLKKSSKGNKGNKGKKGKSKKKSKKKSKEEDSKSKPTINNFSIEEVVRFNIDQQISKLTYNIEKTTKSIEKTLGKIGTTYKDILGTSQQQIDNLGKIKTYNEQLIKSNEDQLKDFRSQYTYIEWTDAQGNSQREAIPIGQYVNEDGSLNQANIQGIGDRAREEAVYRALSGTANTLYNNIMNARKAIDDAQEKMEELQKKLYDTFEGWENELTWIYDITQRLNNLQSLRSRFSEQITLELNKVTTGFQDAATAISTIRQTTQNDNKALLKEIKAQQEMVAARHQELDLAYSTEDEEAYLKSKIASGDEYAIKEAQQKLTAAQMLQDYIKTFKQNKDGSVEFSFDYEKLAEQKRVGNISDTTYNALKERLDKLASDAVEQNNSIKDLTTSVNQIYENIESYLNTQVDLESDLLNGLEEQTEAEIDNLKNVSTSLADAMKDLLDEVKRKLDERRKQEDNAKTERDISQKQQRLAALRADTSGGHQVEIAQLEKEIADAQQSYERSLEDQLLDKLQQQADVAEQQRERQIELLEAQNEIGIDNRETVRQWVENPEQFNKEITDALKQQMDYENAGFLRQEQILREISGRIVEAQQAADQLHTFSKEDIEGENGGGELQDQIDEIEAANSILKEQWGTLLQDIKDAESKVTQAEAKLKAAQEDEAYRLANKNLFASELNSLIQQIERQKKSLEAEARRINNPWEESYEDTYQRLLRKDPKLQALQSRLPQAQADADNTAKILEIAKANTQDAINNLGKAQQNLSELQSQEVSLTDAINQNNKLIQELQEQISALVGKSLLSIEAFVTLTEADKVVTKANSVDAGIEIASKGYATGGLADYTGPAWLDGTTSRPELVLNARDTQNFIALKDILSKVMSSAGSANSNPSNATYEININVDKITSDYDVDKMAERVKKIIVKDSSYRNVTQVRKFR